MSEISANPFADLDLDHQRRIALSVFLAKAILALTLGWLVVHAYFGFVWVGTATVCATLAMAVSLVLFRLGWDRVARAVLLAAPSVVLFVGAVLIHPAGMVEFMLAALVGVPFLVFSWTRERTLLLALVALPFGLWALAWGTDFTFPVGHEIGPDIAGTIVAFGSAASAFGMIALEFGYFAALSSRFQHDLADARDAAERAGRQLRGILAQSPIGVGVTRVDDGRYLYGNQRLAAQLGFSDEDLLAARSQDHYADPAQRDAIVAGLANDGIVDNAEVQFKRADGSDFWVLLTAAPFEHEGQPAILAWYYDITDRKDSEQRLNRIFEESPVGIAVTRAEDGRYLYGNSRLAEQFGMTVPELLESYSPARYADPTQRDPIMERFRTDGRVNDAEVRFKRADGSDFWALLTLSAFDLEGEPAMLGWHYDITDLKRAERESAEKTQILSDVLENIAQGVVKYDGDSKLLIWNQPFEDILGFPDELMVAGRPAMDLITYLAERGDYGSGRPEHLAKQRYKQLWRGDARRGEITVGGAKSYDVMVQPTSDGGIVITYSDITERKQAEQQLNSTLGEISAVLESIDYGVVFMDADLRARLINRAFQEMWAIPDDLIAERPTMEDLIRFNRHSGFYDVEDDKFDDYVRERVEAVRRGPIPARELTRGDGRSFEYQCIALADGGRMITYYDITAMKDAERDLRRSQQNLEMILANSPMGVTINHRDTAKRLYSNPRFLELFGADSEDHLGSIPVAETFVNPEELQTMLALFASDDPIVSMEAQKKRMDGSTWWSLVVRTKITYDGDDALLNWHIDITERKEAEDAVRESEQRFIAMLASSPIAVSVTRLEDGQFMYANPRLSEMLGLSDEEILKTSAADYYTDPTQRRMLVEQFRKDGLVREAEVQFKTSDGSVFWTLLTLLPFDYRNEPAVLGWLYDITERKEAEQRVRESEQRLMAILEASPIAVAIVRMADQRLVFANSREIELFKFDPDRLDALDVTTLYEDDDNWRHLRGQLQKNQPVQDYELRMKRTDGSAFWALASYSRIDHQGEAARLAWFYDISRQKETEAQLADSIALVTASIDYASRIQRAILPDEGLYREMFADHFVHWEPRDVVGGDIYWGSRWGDGAVFMLGDCTGHGVPGAFMTLIAVGALDRAQMEVGQGDVAGLMARMHQFVQIAVNQHMDTGESDDGMELGLCYLHPDRARLTYVGARFSLFVVENGEVEEIKGDRAGIGYRGIPHDQGYTETVVELNAGRQFYMTSDGLIDQVGGDKRRAFGKRRFKELIAGFDGQPFDQRRAAIVEAFTAYQGEQLRRDDVSVMGFRT